MMENKAEQHRTHNRTHSNTPLKGFITPTFFVYSNDDHVFLCQCPTRIQSDRVVSRSLSILRISGKRRFGTRAGQVVSLWLFPHVRQCRRACHLWQVPKEYQSRALQSQGNERRRRSRVQRCSRRGGPSLSRRGISSGLGDLELRKKKEGKQEPAKPC